MKLFIRYAALLTFATLSTSLLTSCNVSGITSQRGTLRIYLDGPIAPMPPIDGPQIAPNELLKMPTVTPEVSE